MDIISFNEAATANGRIENFIENPDSTSGVLTVPKVIASGENVTIPAGRVAVLPNVQVDGTLNIEGEVFIPSGATFSKVVETEGNQTIAGIKTFTSSPIVPTPTAGDNSTKVATTAFVKAKSEADSIGVGQTWQDVTASRSAGVTYTNTAGKPKMIAIGWKNNGTPGNFSPDLVIGGLNIYTASYDGNTYASGTITAIVPNNTTYVFTIKSNQTIVKWAELG